MRHRCQRHTLRGQSAMFCVHHFVPLLLLPRPASNTPTQAVFAFALVAGLFLQHRPCAVCFVVLVASLVMLCNLGPASCWLDWKSSPQQSMPWWDWTLWL